jgi:hypothetical protein
MFFVIFETDQVVIRYTVSNFTHKIRGSPEPVLLFIIKWSL